MKLTSLSVKRRTVKKGTFRKLFANVARKKQRAATSAAPLPSHEGDVPNLGIARALVVILIIHVVAIAGIFVHSNWFDEAEPAVATASEPVIEPARGPRHADRKLPKITGDPYIPVAGDTYAKIARAHGLTERELRDANGNVDLGGGIILNIPAATGNTIVAMEPVELTELRNSEPVLEVPVDEIYSAPMIETEAAARAVLVRPGVNREVMAEAPATGVREPAVAANGEKYTVKAGDTFWSIAQGYNTTPDALMKVNGISDPRKLKIGMKLQVP